MGTASLRIDLDALTGNWRALAALAPGAEAGAVVKADAYGLGIAEVAPALARAGARSFFVAMAEEGAALRRALGGDAGAPEIFVLSGHLAGDAALLREARLVPVLNSPEQVARQVDALPGLPFGVQLDTGMNRLGLEPADWAALAPQLVAAGPRLVMSHLACADEPHHPANAAQLAAFRSMTDGQGLRRSLAATGGTLLGPDYHFDVIRAGIGLYGGEPFAAARPVAALSVPVIQCRDVGPGEHVGYGWIWRAERPARIATLAAGYADGLHRALGAGGARFWAEGIPCPVVGRVSMDLITVDVTHLGRDPAALDLLCPAQGVDALAAAAGTIGYEILTGLGRRYARSYLRTGAEVTA